MLANSADILLIVLPGLLLPLLLFAALMTSSLSPDIANRILQQSKELFMRFGTKSITMDDIARNLGMSKKTIYQYYPDKDHLVLQAFMKHMELECDHLDGVQAKAANAVEEILLDGQQLVLDTAMMNPSLLLDLKKYHPATWKFFEEQKEAVWRRYMLDLLQRGIAEGNFRPEIDVEILSTLRVHLVEIGLANEVFPTDKFNATSVLFQVLDLFVRGVVTPSGLALWEKYIQENNPLAHPRPQNASLQP
jgi:TetR/AcrR family transcriptional regulator, cholesterol catabolism regulator